MAFLSRITPITVQPTAEALASIIFLHGSGDTGDGLWWWLQNILGQSLEFKHVRMIIPTAPERPYTAAQGSKINVWFDRSKVSPDVVEDIEGIDESCKYVNSLIERELSVGIPKNRILVGGFSMGGCLAMHYGYRICPDVAGIFALSSFLNRDSAVFQTLKSSDGLLPPLFQCHGKRDALIPYSWASYTHETLKSLRVPCIFHTYPNLYHQMDREEIITWRGWVEGILSCH